MRRFLILLAAFCAPVAVSATADELCLACEEPSATYRCAIEQPSEKYKVKGALAEEVCSKVLAQKGAHSKCSIAEVPEGGTCGGAERVVTITDYQRAVSDSGESTYEVGAFEIARRNVHDTWLCVTSMFKDC